MRKPLLIAVLIAAFALPAYAAEPVKGVVKGTGTAAKGVAKGTAQAGDGVARGTVPRPKAPATAFAASSRSAPVLIPRSRTCSKRSRIDGEAAQAAKR